MNDFPEIDLRSKVMPTGNISFKGNNDEVVVIDVDFYRQLAQIIGWDQRIRLIRMLRLVRTNEAPVISLKLARDIVEWIERNQIK